MIQKALCDCPESQDKSEGGGELELF